MTLQQAELNGKISRGPSGDIEMVVLSNLGLTNIPDWVFDIDTLKVLILSDNKLTYMPKELLRLKQLQNIKINDNDISVFPSDFLSLDKTVIYLSGNPLNKESLMLLFREMLSENASFKYPKNNLSDPEFLYHLHNDDCHIMEWFGCGGDLFAWRENEQEQWNYGDIEKFFASVPDYWAYRKLPRRII